jgi:hypothetical protein
VSQVSTRTTQRSRSPKSGRHKKAVQGVQETLADRLERMTPEDLTRDFLHTSADSIDRSVNTLRAVLMHVACDMVPSNVDLEKALQRATHQLDSIVMDTTAMRERAIFGTGGDAEP